MVEHFKIGELIIWRKYRMSFRLAFDLRDFAQGFVQGSTQSIGFLDGFLITVIPVVHQSATYIGVMGNCQSLDAAFTVRFQITPKILGLLGVLSCKWKWRRVAPKNDVTMEIIFSLHHAAPFVSNESGELSRLVVGIGGINLFLPCG